MSQTASAFTDFGQKVDLTASIRNILRNYPEGTAVLKELVQNADDAGARMISICLDMRQHGTEAVVDAAMGQFQGPALLAYNDAIFTEQDFKSIQRIGDSLKKTAEDQAKIGRFGIGFNAVYHWTDLPSFVSSNYLVMLDPQARFLPNVNPSNPGKMVDWVKSSQVLSTFRDQFAPYELPCYNLDFAAPFSGTLFRLPLRTPEQAETSSLSKRALGVEEAEALLDSLRAEASAMLLFLKSIETIEIKVFRPSALEAETKFRCSIANISQELRSKRAFVSDAPKFFGGGGGKGAAVAVAADFSLLIDCVDASSPATVDSYVEQWEVCNQLGGASANAIAINPSNALLRLVPWGGLAACITPHKSTALLGGLAYCFLPLPVQTGLPVMVNGFFELSSNRRDVWQAGVDMTGDGKTRAEWNLSLMRDVIAPSYMRLLLRLRDLLGFSARYQELWPSSKVAAPWDQVVRSALERCREQRLLRVYSLEASSSSSVVRTGAGEGSLSGLAGDAAKLVLQPASMLLGGLGNMLTTNKGSADADLADASWVMCKQAILLPVSTSHGLDTEGESERLVEFLVLAGQPVVVCIEALRETLESSRTATLIATPPLVRAVLKSPGLQRPQSSQQQAASLVPPAAICTFLLRYCLSDLKPDGNLSDLHLLPILPLLSNEAVASIFLFTPAQSKAVKDLCGMGFSISQATQALSKTKFDVMQAAEFLASSPDATSSLTSSASSVVIIPDDEEQRVFRRAAPMLLARDLVGPKERAFLAHAQMQSVSNIRPFQAYLVPDLLRHILPPACSVGKAVALQNKGQSLVAGFSGGSDALFEFIRAFWAYAAVRAEVVSAVAEGAAVVPSVGFDELFPLSRLSNLICQVKGDVALPVPVLEILKRLGMHVVDPTALPDGASMPKVYWDYVNNPSRSGVIAALETLMRSRGSVFSALEAADRDELRLYLASAEPVKTLSPQELQVIRALPIFTSYSNSSSAAGYMTLLPQSQNKAARPFATLSDCARLADELFPPHFVKHKSAQDLQLLECLGVSVLSRGAYFRTELLPSVEQCYAKSREATERSILEMLVELKSLVEEDKRIVQVLQSTAFLTAGGSGSGSLRLHVPSQLYDPLESELRSLLDDSFFPSTIFQREDILVFLRSVGLQQTLNWPGIVACAKSVANMEEENDEATAAKLRQAENLLRFLDKNIASLLGEDKKKESSGAFSLVSSFRSLFGEKQEDPSVPIEQYVTKLINLAWVPTPSLATHPCIPWPPSTQGLSCTACPVDTRPLSDAWLCSSTRRIVEQTVTHPSLQRLLRWNQPLDFKTIAIQLRELAKRFLELRKEAAAAVADNEVAIRKKNNEMQDARETVTGLIPQLYQRLNNVSDNEQDSAELVALLASQSWIWVGETFVEPDKVALVASVNATPYLFQLPQDLRVYSRLLAVFKVKQVFSSRDYIQVLRAMAVDAGVKEGDAGAPLTDASIDLACSLVTLLSTDGSVSATAQKELVYIPDNGGRLALSTEVVNDDVPWMSGPEYMSIRVGCRLIHPNISSHVAEKLGVKSLRLTLVSRNVDSNLFSTGDSSSSVESFGQAESLTSRLRTILDMYPDGNPIFSELLQNADDAGASVVRIMLDENSYGTESLLDSKMGALQGPSLIVVNDAVFTEADYRALARIGHGSKLEKLATTGRFGLGFNSTYHLTDTPTFVSGDYMVIFDPHCAYAPGATVNQPGLRIKFSGSGLRSTFRQQFQPFEFFGCDFASPYQGTLFRFPLRSSAMARKSEISARSYSVADVQANLQQLVGQLSHHILFLRSVRTVEIYHCPAGSSTPVLKHRATTAVSDVEATNSQNLLRYFDKKAVGAMQSSRDQFYTDLQSTPDNKLPLLSSRIKVTLQNAGSEDEAESLEGGSSTTDEVEYLILTGLRGGDAKRMACDPKTRHLKLVPMGGVAACLAMRRHGSSETERFPTLSGQAFCFLPLPVQTKLPVHLNAYWELSSNRRDIWRGEDTKGEARLRSDWNACIMKDVLAPLYAALLLKVSTLPESKAVLKPGAYPVLSLLPCPVPTDHWSGVASALFPLLAGEKLIWSNLNGGRYIALRDAWLLEVAGPDKQDDSKARLEGLLLRENLAVACVPGRVLKPLLDSACVAGEVTPELVRRHFSNTSIPHLALAELDDALFMLQYAFRDIDKSNFSSLVGLPLLPLENGRLGVFSAAGFSTPIFTVSDAERKLLSAAGSRLVAADAVLGHSVASSIRDPAFSTAINVKPLCPQDILLLLREFVPPLWFSDTTVVVDRASVAALSQDWLTALWSYLLDGNNNLALFENSMPVLPVLQPSGLPKGAYLAKISPRAVPVLHMTYKDMSPLAAAALSDVGVYIFDPSVLGGLSYSQEIAKLLAAPTPRGVLEALSAVSGAIKRYAESTRPPAPGAAAKVRAAWSSATCDAMRDFVLDEVVGKCDTLSPEDCVVLCSLPIWPRHACEEPEKKAHKYGPISLLGQPGSSSLQLAPRGMDTALLSDNHVMMRGERDRPLYRLLGLHEPSKGTFFASYVIPRIEAGAVPDALLDSLVTSLLRDLSALEAEHPGLSDLVRNSRLVRCAGAASGGRAALQAPVALYDPHVPGLKDLLPAETFPASLYCDPSLLMALRSLGLNGSITCDGILQAARSIQADYETVLRLSPTHAQAQAQTQALAQAGTQEQHSSEAEGERVSSIGEETGTEALAKEANDRLEASRIMAGAVRRSTGLLRYMEVNIESLLGESDPEGLAEALSSHEEAQTASAASEDEDDDYVDAEAETRRDSGPERIRSATPSSALLGGQWSKELRAITWVPAFTSPPLRSAEGLPWTSAVHKGLLAAPSQCCHVTDLWLCSATTRVSSAEVSAPLLKQLLGWSKPVCGRSAALQLLAQAEIMERSSSGNRERVSEACFNAFPKLLQCLQAAMGSESAAEVQYWQKALKGRPVVWISGRFVEANRVAFRALSSVNTEPYLFVVPQELASHYRVVLRSLGVKECFGAADLAGMMRELHALQNGAPLTPNKVEVAVGILKLLVRLINGTPSAAAAEAAGGADSTAALQHGKVVLAPTPPSKPPKSELQKLKNGSPPPLPPRPPVEQPQVSLKDLGLIFMPDKAGVLASATTLTFDDAPWISAALMQKGTNIRLVNAALSLEDALALGAKSLREQLFAGDEIVCPDSRKLAQLLKDDTVAETLCDILAFADHLGAHSVHVLYDPRTHPTESLMHPGLASAQGPALVVHIDGPVLTSEGVAQALSDINVPSVSEERGLVVAQGKKLMSTFAVTDCLQIVSGREFFIFDPIGSHLLSEGGGTEVKQPSGKGHDEKRRAQRCFLTAAPRGASPTKDSAPSEGGVLSRFPDQFAPFLALPFGLQRALSDKSAALAGTILRMPLRASTSSLSAHVCSEQTIRLAYAALKPMMQGSLVLSQSLLKATLERVDATNGDILTDAAMYLLSAPAKRSSRLGLLAENGWKRNTLAAMFTTFVPPEMSYTVTVSTKSLVGGWLHSSKEGQGQRDFEQATDNWLVVSTMGAGRAKDEALKDPYRAFCLKPLVTVAVKLYSADELEDLAAAPEPGLFFSRGAPLGVSGLPFHVEGCFLSDIVDRQVPLTELVTPNRPKQLNIAHPKDSSEQPLQTGTILNWNLRLLQTALELLVPKVWTELTQGEASKGPGGVRRTAVAGVYKYWPYLSRMSPQTASAATRCRLLNSLAAAPLFLTRSGFSPLDQAILPAWKWGPEVVAYLQTMLPVALCPAQVATDFAVVQQRVVSLSPAKLRDSMRADAATQASRLRGRYELVLPLLGYCLSDLAKHAGEGEFVRRKACRDLAGVPLLPMADGSVRGFPRSARERVCVAPPAAHALLPQLKGSFAHPTAMSPAAFALLEDGLVRDALYISGFTASFLRDHLATVLPPHLQHCQAVRWTEGGSAGGAAGRGVREKMPATGGSQEISELLLFVLWRDMLSKETSQAELEALGQWPLVPVVSRGRRLLLSPALLPHLFSLVPSDAQDTQRAHWAREAGRLSSLVLADAARSTARAAGAGAGGASPADAQWEWVGIRPNSGSCRSPPEATAISASPQPGPGQAQPQAQAQAQALSQARDEDDEEDFSQQAVVVDATPADSTDVAAAEAVAVNAGPGEAVAVSVAAVDGNQPGGLNYDSMDGLGPSADTEGLSAPPSALLHAVSRLGLPVLDGALFEGPPRLLDCSGHWSRRLLRALHALTQANVIVTTSSAPNASALETEEPLLCFDDYSPTDRLDLLLEIFEGHKAVPFSPSEVDMLKHLRLFSASAGGDGQDGAGAAVSLIECGKRGVFWCANTAVLDGLALTSAASGEPSSAGSASASAAAAPVLLQYHPALLPLYTLVGVEELTAAIAVRKFTLPALQRADGERRLELMVSLAERWPAYRGDEELVAQLKTVAFLPYWSAADPHLSPSAAHALLPSALGLYRKPSDLLSWGNSALLEALQGAAQPQYFAPPSLRTAELALMCSDLGMAAEINKESFLRVAMDIQAEGAACGAGAGVTNDAVFDPRRQAALDRGRRILRYVKDSDQGVQLFDKDLSRKLAGVCFVPMLAPVRTEPGGFVVYSLQLGRFNQTLSKANGALGFTVLPVLDDDIAPHQIFFSSLGITSMPTVETVLRHIRQLTQTQGPGGESQSVDRWNSEQFPARSTFSQIFSFLSDHWKDLGAAVKRELRGAAIVPVGHLLVKPGRLFFRLPEDLSPFMHEAPRYLGAHEAFLKTLGVREEPSSADYCAFLADLAGEARGQALNPNELRAVVAIVQSVAADAAWAASSQGQSAGEGATAAPSPALFVPDEDSVLRSAGQCLVNDDAWVRARAGDSIRLRMGLHVLHPSLALTAQASRLAPRLSSVLAERLGCAEEELEALPSEAQSRLGAQYSLALAAPAWLEAVAALAARGAAESGSAGTALAVAPQAAARRLAGVSLRFVRSLPTCLVVRNPQQPLAPDVALREGTEGRSEALAFVLPGQGQGQGDTVIVNTSLAVAPLSVEIALALGVCRLLGLDTSLATTLGLVLASVSPASSMLPAAPAPPVSAAADPRALLHLLRVGSDAVTLRERRRGQPGEPLTEADARLLELKPQRVFRLGEVVAYSPADADTDADTDHAGADVGAVLASSLVYASVVAAGDEGASGTSVRRLMLRGLHDRSVGVLSTSVYSFKSGRDAAASSSPFSGGVSTPERQHRLEDSPRATALSPASASASASGAAGAGAREAVSHAEVLGALQGLLRRVGVPVSLDQQAMLQRVVELEATQRRLDAELGAERAQLGEAREALHAASAAHHCQVCFTNDVTHVLVPCGHTICAPCLGQLQPRNKCPWCRNATQASVRFYLSSSPADDLD